MKAIRSIIKKEFLSYFSSPIAYIVIFTFLLLSGFFFYSLVSWFNSVSVQLAQNPYYYQQININQMVFSPFFNNSSTFNLAFSLLRNTIRSSILNCNPTPASTSNAQ